MCGINGRRLPFVARPAGRLHIVLVVHVPAGADRNDVIDLNGRVAVAKFLNLANGVLSNVVVAQAAPTIIVATFMRLGPGVLDRVLTTPTTAANQRSATRPRTFSFWLAGH